MSNLIPSTFASPSATARPPATTAGYQDCQTCRITGTLTFSAVGIYALVQARRTAKTGLGRGAASIAGLGFLAIAAARWTQGAPPLDVREN